MEFAGNKYIYLYKLKKDKIKKIRNAEKNNKDAPLPPILEKPKEDNDLSDSDDGVVQVNSNDFNIDLVNSRIQPFNPLFQMNQNMNMGQNMQMNQNAAPGIVFKKAIDTNVCVISFKEIENISLQIPKLYKCEICQAYLNKFSNLKPTNQKDKYSWKCEFCQYVNNDLLIEPINLPKNEVIENCILPPIQKETSKDDDSSLIFCFDISGSMCQSYNIGEELKQKFNKIIGKKKKLTIHYLIILVTIILIFQIMISSKIIQVILVVWTWLNYQ